MPVHVAAAFSSNAITLSQRVVASQLVQLRRLYYYTM
jgi:hypothetical protein